jgi:hypothetical protein
MFGGDQRSRSAADTISIHTIADRDVHTAQEQQDADFALALALEEGNGRPQAAVREQRGLGYSGRKDSSVQRSSQRLKVKGTVVNKISGSMAIVVCIVAVLVTLGILLGIPLAGYLRERPAPSDQSSQQSNLPKL